MSQNPAEQFHNCLRELSSTCRCTLKSGSCCSWRYKEFIFFAEVNLHNVREAALLAIQVHVPLGLLQLDEQAAALVQALDQEPELVPGVSLCMEPV